MRSGIFVAAGVFNISISRTGSLPLRRQIKQKTLRSLFKITSDAPEHEFEGSTPLGGGIHRILTGITNATREHVIGTRLPLIILPFCYHK
jgi:hypothetical protein